MKTGSLISHYRIVSRLGVGGMGEVWLAKDIRLGRNVAVKFLHERLAGNPDWLRRFLREARAVASLNHPNIAQVHELFMEEGVHMIVMEYVDGRTLTQRIREKPMTLAEVVHTGIQVADALEEAHSKGIVHRDIKPGNIMLTARGIVKVLDFGIAKLPAEPNETGEQMDATGDPEPHTTRPGEIRGTPRYMSREQCLGMEIDHRSDLFSVGSVLYELATGKHAFQGEAAADVYKAILNHTPTEPSSVNTSLPGSFDRIVTRAMEKDRDLRYSSAAELRADLKALSQAMHPVAGAAAVQGNKTSWILAGALLTVLVGIVGWHNFGREAAAPQVNLEAVPLTATPGTETQPNFSPDGTQIAFASNGEGAMNWDIYTKMIRGGPAMRLTTSPDIDYSPAWSPEGSRIAFLRKSETGPSGFYLIPAFGGAEQFLAPASANRDGTDSPFLAWAPDGKTLVVSDKGNGETASLFAIDVASGTRKNLTSPPSKSFGDSSPVFSPDGKRLLFVRSLGMGIQDIYSMSPSGGEPKQLTFDKRRIYGLAWNPADGRILFSSGRVGNARLWRLPADGGKPEHILGVGDAASFIALSPKGERLAFTRTATDTNIWQYDLKQEIEPRRLIASTRHEQGPQYSPDGKRIVFASTRTGAWEIYVCNADGTGTLQLTTLNGKPAGSPQWSPDGKSIAFDARPDGNPDIYIIDLGGGSMKHVVRDPAQDVAPSFSRDGKWLYYASNRSGRFELWKSPIAGGPALQITKSGGFYGMESLDGREVYYAKSLSGPGLWKAPPQGGEESLVLEQLRGGYWSYWVPTRDGVYYLDQETREEAVEYFIKFHAFGSKKEKMVRALPERPFNSGLALAPDGRRILYTQADRTDTDIMLVEGFR